MRQRYQLGKTVSETNHTLKLWETEKGFVEIEQGALAVPIMLDEERKGYVLHGKGKLLLDAIVETDEGAVGRSIEKELKDPFLMLSDTDKTGESFDSATAENLTKMSYESQEAFLEMATELFDKFFETKSTCCHTSWHRNRGFVFAFENDAGKLDLLIADESSLVYTAKNVVFMSNRDNEVLKMPNAMLCSHCGKSVIINKCGPFMFKKGCIHI